MCYGLVGWLGRGGVADQGQLVDGQEKGGKGHLEGVVLMGWLLW